MLSQLTLQLLIQLMDLRTQRVPCMVQLVLQLHDLHLLSVPVLIHLEQLLLVVLYDIRLV